MYYAPQPVLVPVGPRMERRSTGMMVAGIVGLGVGGAALLIGAFATSLSADCFDCHSTNSVGIGMLIFGGIAVAAGIPLTIYGAGKVPVGGEPAAALKSPLPAWAGLPAGQGWKWKF
jgi:hypothetical protein